MLLLNRCRNISNKKYFKILALNIILQCNLEITLDLYLNTHFFKITDFAYSIIIDNAILKKSRSYKEHDEIFKLYGHTVNVVDFRILSYLH